MKPRYQWTCDDYAKTWEGCDDGALCYGVPMPAECDSRVENAVRKLRDMVAPRDRPRVHIAPEGDGMPTIKVRVRPGVAVPILPSSILGFPVQVTRVVWRGFGGVPTSHSARAESAREKFLGSLGVPLGLPPDWLRGARIVQDAAGYPVVEVLVKRGCHPSIPYQMDNVLFRMVWVD